MTYGRYCQRKYNKESQLGTTYRVKCSEAAVVRARYRYRPRKDRAAQTCVKNFCATHLVELETRRGVTNIVVEVRYPTIEGVPV